MRAKKVCAVDIGYGNTKYVNTGDFGKITCSHFPSVAVLDNTVKDDSDSFSTQQDVTRVSVSGAHYKVGPDAMLSVSPHDTGRVLTKEYSATDRYRALYLGALARMGEKSIDLLVTGLPVQHYRNKAMREGLGGRLCGEHSYPDGSRITVKNAKVISQPLGGFAHYALSSNTYGEMKNTLSIVVDVGFFTVDWICVKGLQIIEERSGSASMGVSQLLNALAQEIAVDCGEPFSDINRLDESMRTGYKLIRYGAEYSYSHLLPRVIPKLDHACEALAASVGTMDDIGSIILVGGGARLYVNSIRRVCKKNTIVPVDDALYANVKGFHAIGLKY
jgi:plasmid segregation protein ParM